MAKRIFIISLLLLGISVTTGCAGVQLMEVRQKWKMGPEFRTDSKQHHKDRWSIQTGIEAKWSNGWKTGITYRRRDNNGGSGGNDNGVWVDFSYPLWKRSKK